MTDTSPYHRFVEAAQEAAQWHSILALLHWDQEVTMPSQGVSMRAQQLTLLSHLIHKQATSSSYAKLLGDCIDLESGKLLGNYASTEAANLHEAHRQWRVDAKTPASWVKRMAHIQGHAAPAWARAREERSFAIFQPWLEQIVELNRERAAFLGYQEHPYDALLDRFEPGLSLSQLMPLYEELQAALIPMREEALARPPLSPPQPLHCSPEQQLLICRQLIVALGLPETYARLDLSSHPFCQGITPDDVRLTTRITSSDPWSAIGSTMHESGHALYDLGLSKEGFGLAQGTYCSLGVHESQSRLWECRIGHSYAFLEWMGHRLQEQGVGPIDLPHLVRWLNRVRRDPIRVEADEVSYSLHIILRTLIEADLVSGRLAVADLPAAWNALSKELLGLEPEHDGVGCLQDIHWAMGEMGYFPSYALGNLYGAQLFAAYAAAHPGHEADFRHGSFGSLRQWLQQHVWSLGRTMTPRELIERATGHPPSCAAFIAALRARLTTLT